MLDNSVKIHEAAAGQLKTGRGATRQNTTEQAIMEAAEELFLDMGYNQATTTMIARKAGVTHAMLHYYFRTKEHIFMKVLEKTLNELMQSFRPVMSKDEPFWETLEKGISTHFDFFVRHPRFVTFLYDTVMHNPELVERLKESFMPVIRRIYSFHACRIQEEMDDGTIRKVDPMHLLADIASLNLSAFMFFPVAGRLFGGTDESDARRFLEERKTEIIELIRYRLYGR